MRFIVSSSSSSSANYLLVVLILFGHCYRQSCAVRKSYRAGVPETSPYQDPAGVKMSGKAFLGISLARNYGSIGNPDSETLQDAFDLNEVTDREYKHIVSLNDDGWLIGGGEAGPYNLPAADSAHITLMDIGTFDENWGGITEDDIIDAIESGDILIPQMEVMPTRVRMNWDTPPELEILFDLEPTYPTEKVPLPINWQLRFVANQLVDYFSFPNKAVPGRFHCSVARKVNFRSYKARGEYFEKCNKALAGWRQNGPQPLVGEDTWKYFYSGNSNNNNNNAQENDDGSENDNNDYYSSSASGVWLYSNRQNRTKFIRPNFLPPYDNDEEKMKIISKVLNKGRYLSSLHFYVSQGTIVVSSLCIVAFLMFLFRIFRRYYKKEIPKLNASFLQKDCDDSSSSSNTKSYSTPPLSPVKFEVELSPASSESGDDEPNRKAVSFDYGVMS